MSLNIGKIKVEAFQECGRTINKLAKQTKRTQVIPLNNTKTYNQPNKLVSFISNIVNKFSK